MTNFFVAILLIFSITSGFEISSKVDLDSEEKCPDPPSNDSDPIIVLIKNATELNTEMRGFQTSGTRLFIGGNPNFRGIGKTTRTQNNHNVPPRRKATKNIDIVVNGLNIFSSVPGIVICNEEYCETKVIASTDDEGNAIVTVNIKVLANGKTLKVDDVPIIEGVRASGYDNVGNTATFFRENRRFTPYPNFIHNNIPQEQMPRRNPFGSHTVSFQPRNFGPPRQAWRPWTPRNPPLDDKIEPPLSKTDLVVQ